MKQGQRRQEPPDSHVQWQCAMLASSTLYYVSCVLSFNRNRRGPLWGACSVVERSVNYGSLEPRKSCKVSASCNSYACRPASFCRRLLRVSRAPRACCRQLSIHFPEDRARCREPAPSVNERSFPARPGTGGTESTQTMGRVAAEM